MNLALWIIYIAGAVTTAAGVRSFLGCIKNDLPKAMAIGATALLWPVLWTFVFIAAMWEGPL